MHVALSQYPGGVNVDELSEAEAMHLMQSGWQYGDPAPPTFRYNDHGLLEHIDRTVWDNVAQYGSLAVPAVATIATGGAASPWLMAATAGITGAMTQGGRGWKEMLKAGLVGGATGGLGGSIANSGLSTTAKIGAQAGLGAASGGIQGGTRGALLGSLAGGGSAAIGQVGNQMAQSGAPMYARAATQAGLTTGLNRALGYDWTTSGFYGGLGAANTALVRPRNT
jgi:hypothetical protein